MHTPSTPWQKLFYPVVFVVWGICIVGLYLYYHPLYLKCELDTLRSCLSQYDLSTLLTQTLSSTSAFYGYILLAVYGVLIGWYRRRDLEVHVTPLLLLAGAYVFGHVSLTLLLTFVPEEAVVGDTGIRFLTMQWSILTKWGLVVVALTAISVLSASIGRWVLRRMKLSTVSLWEEFLFSFGLGCAVLSYALFGLLAMKQFSVVPIVLLLIVLMSICLRDLVWWVRTITRHRIDWTFRMTSVWCAALVLSLIIIGYTTIDILTPFPYQWDGMYRYANTAQLIAAQGTFVTGMFPYPTEILMALGPVLAGTMMVGIAIPWFMALIAGALLYTLAREHASKDISMLAVLASLSMPTVFIIMSISVKVDFAAVTYVLLTFFALMRWYESRSTGWLILTSLFLGVALMSKLTAIFCAFGIGIAIAYIAIRKHRMPMRSLIITAGIVLCFIALPIVPWIGKHLVEAERPLTLHGLIQGGRNGPDMGVCSLVEDERYIQREQTDERREIPFTVRRETLERFWGYRPHTFLHKLALPWYITMNTRFSTPFMYIGPVMLALLPLVLFVWYAGTGTRRAPYLPLGISIACSYALWVVFGAAMTWYALPIWCLYLVLVAWICHEHVRTAPWKRAVLAVVLLCIIPSLLFRFATRTDGSRYLFVAGAWSEEELWYSEPPHFQALADLINADVPTAEQPKYVYNVSTLVQYRIAHNDTRVYLDQYLDSLNCVLEIHDDDYDASLQYLKDRGFKYLLATPDIVASDSTPERSIVRKVQRATKFIETMKNEGKLHEIVAAGMQQDKVIAFEIR